MDYDPIKNSIGDLVAGRPFLTKLFYAALQLLFLRNWYVRRELNTIVGQQPKGKRLRVLDAGTGFGQFSYFLAKKPIDIEIKAVDVKQDYLDRAREFMESQGLSDRVRFAIDDLTQLESSGPFDLIISIDVMEHIEEDEKVFGHFCRVLAPGGVVLINTPSDQGGSDAVGPEGESFIGEHVRDGYSKEELSSKLRRAGLRPMQMFYSYGSLGELGWRLLIKLPMTWLGLSKFFFLLLPFYYVVALPVGLLLNFLDVQSTNSTGTGLVAIAEKPRS